MQGIGNRVVIAKEIQIESKGKNKYKVFCGNGKVFNIKAENKINDFLLVKNEIDDDELYSSKDEINILEIYVNE